MSDTIKKQILPQALFYLYLLGNHWSRPVAVLDPSWLSWPLNSLVRTPTAVPGGVGLPFWTFVSRKVAAGVANAVKK